MEEEDDRLLLTSPSQQTTSKNPPTEHQNPTNKTTDTPNPAPQTSLDTEQDLTPEEEEKRLKSICVHLRPRLSAITFHYLISLKITHINRFLYIPGIFW